MRISIIGKQHPDSLARNFSATCKQIGFQVQAVDEDNLVGAKRLRQRYYKLFSLVERHPRFQDLQGERLVREIARFRPDVVLNTHQDIHPKWIRAMRSALGAKAKLLFVYPDANANLGREYPLAGDYDALFFKDPYVIELFRSRLGLNVHYLPEACNPAWHRAVELSKDDQARYGCDVTTAGNMYYYRALILEPLLEMGLDLKIWGGQYPGWLESPLRPFYPNVYVMGEQKAKAFRAAKIVVNTLSHKEVTGTNARTFEVAGCGGFQIADWRPATDDLFVADKEIVFFRSREELHEKIRFYLQHPEKRREIADAGMRRAHTDHTYQKRLEEIFRVTGL